MIQQLKSTYKTQMSELKNIGELYPWHDTQAYCHWLSQAHYIVKHSTRLLAYAASQLEFKNNPIHIRLAHHIIEEFGHEKLIERDFKALDKQLDHFPVTEQTIHLVAKQFEITKSTRGIGLFGYILLLEGLAIEVGPMVQSVVEQNISSKAIHFLKLHSGEDVAHMQEAFKTLENMTDTELQVIDKALIDSAALYKTMMRILVENHQPENLRKKPTQVEL